MPPNMPWRSIATAGTHSGSGWRKASAGSATACPSRPGGGRGAVSGADATADPRFRRSAAASAVVAKGHPQRSLAPPRPGDARLDFLFTARHRPEDIDLCLSTLADVVRPVPAAQTRPSRRIFRTRHFLNPLRQATGFGGSGKNVHNSLIAIIGGDPWTTNSALQHLVSKSTRNPGVRTTNGAVVRRQPGNDRAGATDRPRRLAGRGPPPEARRFRPGPMVYGRPGSIFPEPFPVERHFAGAGRLGAGALGSGLPEPGSGHATSRDRGHGAERRAARSVRSSYRRVLRASGIAGPDTEDALKAACVGRSPQGGGATGDPEEQELGR